MLPEAQALLGVLAGTYDYDWNEAARQFQLAMGREPVPPDVRLWYGVFYLQPQGRTREAIEQHKTILRTDPMNLTFLNALAESFAAGEQWDQCDAIATQMIEIAPDYFVGHLFRAAVALVEGRWAAAYDGFERTFTLGRYNLQLAREIFTVLAERSNEADRAQILPTTEGRPIPLAMLAHFRLLFGDHAGAASAMETAVAQRNHMVARNLGWKRWKSNPCWAELARMIHVPE